MAKEEDVGNKADGSRRDFKASRFVQRLRVDCSDVVRMWRGSFVCTFIELDVVT
jgi:hypothetical protein